MPKITALGIVFDGFSTDPAAAVAVSSPAKPHTRSKVAPLNIVGVPRFATSGATEKLFILKKKSLTLKKHTMGSQHLTQQEKAKLYDDMLLRYQRLQEQVRLLKAKSFEVSDEDQRQINIIEASMKRLYNDTQKLF